MWHMILSIVLLLCLIAGILVYVRPRFVPGSPPANRKSISIIIPARNEAHNLPALLESIAHQNISDMEVIVADDGSTDGTGEVAACYGVQVVRVPTGEWQGKSHACSTGANHAENGILVFMDADTSFSRSTALSSILARYEAQGARGVLSIQPFHQLVHSYETLSTLFNIVTIAGMNIFSVFRRHARTKTVFGPFLMTNRQDYLLTGGHRVAWDTVIEGTGIHRAYSEENLPITLYLGHGMLQFRMYPEGLRSLMEGWKKHIAIGADNTQGFIMALIMLWIGGALGAFAYVLYSAVWAPEFLPLAGCFYILYVLHFKWVTRRIVSIGWHHAFAYPLHILFFFHVYGISFINTHMLKKVKWKGRQIDLKRNR